MLRYFLGLDNDEVAAELGITAGAAPTAISRGLGALRIAAADENPFADATPSPAGPMDEVTSPAAVTSRRPGAFDLTAARPRSQEGS